MLKRFLTIGFIAGTLFTLLGLGIWQVQRLQWKNHLIAQYEAAQQAAPLPLEKTDLNKIKDLQYQPVTVSGTFIHEQELHLGGRRYYGKTGYQILTPVLLEKGRVVLVNRGWVPTEYKESEARQGDTKPEQAKNLKGMVRLPLAPGLFTPDNHPDKNFWFYVDIDAMAKDIGAELLPFTVELVDPDHLRGVFPAPSDGKVVLRNDHLGYAITWFALAIAAAVIFWLRLRKVK